MKIPTLTIRPLSKEGQKALESLLHPSATALLVIDIQFDYCSPEGKLAKFFRGMGFSGDTKTVEQIIPKLSSFIAEARKYRVPIVWTRFDETPDHMPENLALNKRKRFKPPLALCTPGTPGFEYFKIHPIEGDKEILKYQPDAFTNLELDKYLRDRNIKTVIFSGVYTSRCVDSTLRSAAARGYHCVIPQDLVAMSSFGYQQIEHNAALSVWDSIFGYVIESDDIVKIWKDQTSV